MGHGRILEAVTGASRSSAGLEHRRGLSRTCPGRLSIEPLLCATWGLLAFPPSGMCPGFDWTVSVVRTASCPPPVAVPLGGEHKGEYPGQGSWGWGFSGPWQLTVHLHLRPQGPTPRALVASPPPPPMQPPHFCRSMRSHGSRHSGAPALIPPSSLSPSRRLQLASVLWFLILSYLWVIYLL